MTNISTSAVTYDQFDVFLGTRSPTSTTPLYNIAVETASDRKSRMYYDNNNNYVVDSGDTGYYIQCPDEGMPYAMHDIQNTPTIMQSWFRQDTSGSGSSYNYRFFWQGRVAYDGNKFNPNWGASGGGTSSSVVMSEAEWCADTTGVACPTGGTFRVGVGTTGTLSDSLTWPTGADVAYGRNVWHSIAAPFWVHDAWYPAATSDGADAATSFSGC